MATNESGKFETDLARLDEIVQTLEKGDAGLDESVKLFKEGKALAARCEQMLKDAQASIEAAATADANGARSGGPGTATPLFGSGRDGA
jgi:exodeoxyribonuclease VII small subunit